MTKQRADLGFSQAFERAQPTDWVPKPVVQQQGLDLGNVVRATAESAGFVSRPVVERERATTRQRRIYRTGRREQLNIKVRAEDLERFYQLCDQCQWVQGFAFQRALEALTRELHTTAT